MLACDAAVLEDALNRLHEVDALLADVDAGICLLHLAACIASLESRLQQVAAERACAE